jgi:Nucleotidyltransferase
MSVLSDAAAICAAEWWVGAGVIRDRVWDVRFGSGFDLAKVRDVDVAFFDATDLSPERDQQMESALLARNPRVSWDAKNQAAVHLWYSHRFGLAVEPFASAAEAVATWPEFAVCVAVQLSCNPLRSTSGDSPARTSLGGCASPSRRRLKSRRTAYSRQSICKSGMPTDRAYSSALARAAGSPDDNGRCGRRRRRRSPPRSGSRSISPTPNRVLR